MTFKSAVSGGVLTVGVFVKTPSPIVVEVLSLTDLDCLCLDAEHAPFDRSAIDGCVMAARAAGKPVLVRPASSSAEHIQTALDCGASGVVLPHIRSADDARWAVSATHFGPGGRGYSSSTRSAGYNAKSMATHLALSAAETLVVVQIEDVEAIEAIDAIATVPGVDVLFVGRIDLTVAMGAPSPDDARVVAAVDAVCDAGRRHGKTVGMFLNRPGDVAMWKAKGASVFLLGSDHVFLTSGAEAMMERATRD